VSAPSPCYDLPVSTFEQLIEFAPERIRGLKRVEYERLAETGAFVDERIELLRGVMYFRSGRVRPLKRVEYEWLAETGAFVDERVELLDGVMVRMSPQGIDHADAIMRLTRMLVSAVGTRAWVRPQLPFAPPGEALPEPDLAIIATDDYRRANPERALLLIEVAADSLRTDRKVKAALYARANAPEYWIVNVVDRCVERHANPKDGAYTTVTVLRPGEVLRIPTVDDAEIRVSDIFG
jgi:Uma2 family endonuclease